MRRTAKTLHFPLAGVSLAGNYPQQAPPYTSPWAVNVRGEDVVERRDRGGSRPGLAKVCATKIGDSIQSIIPVTWTDSAGVRHHDIVAVADGTVSVVSGSVVEKNSPIYLKTDAGDYVVDEAGNRIVFDSIVSTVSGTVGSAMFDAVERNGDVYVADSVLRRYDPAGKAFSDVVATSGTVPTGQSLICLYRDRLILSGSDHVWYACRQGDVLDWDFGDDMDDSGRAIVGELSQAGRIGEPVTALVPNDGDRSMLLATAHGLFIMLGDPATGDLKCLSDEIGVVAPGAWANSPDGYTLFLSHDGVYFIPSGAVTKPTRFSAAILPDTLRNVNTATHKVSMAYDAEWRGFHLYLTPVNGTAVGTHWFIDYAAKAFWPVLLPLGMQPKAVARLQASTACAEVVLGCADGYLRKFSAAAATDDGTEIQSKVLLGPLAISPDGFEDAMLNEVHGMIGNSSATLGFKVFSGNYAEEAVDAAMAYINGTSSAFDAGGLWAAGRNRVVRARVRNPWQVICIEGTGAWTYESVVVTGSILGRAR